MTRTGTIYTARLKHNHNEPGAGEIMLTQEPATGAASAECQIFVNQSKRKVSCRISSKSSVMVKHENQAET